MGGAVGDSLRARHTRGGQELPPRSRIALFPLKKGRGIRKKRSLPGEGPKREDRRATVNVTVPMERGGQPTDGEVQESSNRVSVTGDRMGGPG